MREADLAAAMRLKAQAGWNQVEDDWRFFLHARPAGCFVAEVGAGVVGTVTTVAYGTRLAWISLLLVDEAVRRQGIGSRLMKAALESLDGWATIGLDATPAGRPVYERLGFRAEYGLLRLTRPGRFCPETCQVCVVGTCPVSERDLAQVSALDRRALGADRTALLHALYTRAPEAGRLAGPEGRPAGFCLGRHGSRLSQLGPVVAGTVEQASSLCEATLAAWAGRTGKAAVIDVPASQDAFLAWLCASGFEVQRPFTRMACGAPLPPPSGAAQTFAICGPEFG